MDMAMTSSYKLSVATVSIYSGLAAILNAIIGLHIASIIGLRWVKMRL